MEVAGTILSAAGLAGLFSTCVDCFALIKLGRNFGRDYELLMTKLDVEKTRLLQWGDGVGLLGVEGRSRHPLLDNNNIRPTIEKALNSIALLLNDAKELRSKYGMCEEKGQGTRVGQTDIVLLSAPRLYSFQANLNRFYDRITSRQKRTNMQAKTIWAVSDRQGFVELIKDLHDMIEGLYAIVPILPHFQKLLVREDMDRLPDNLALLRLVEEACSDRGDEWSEGAIRRREESEIASQNVMRTVEWLEGIPTGIQQYPGHFKNPEHPLLSLGEVQPSPTMRRIGVFRSAEIEKNLISQGVISELVYGLGQEPNNIKAIRQRLIDSHPVSFSAEDFANLQFVIERTNELTLKLCLVSLLFSGETTMYYKTGASIPFRNFEPFTGCTSLPVANPDFYFGSQPRELHLHILQQLSRYILPSTRRYSPILPNLFIEVDGTARDQSNPRQFACYTCVLGARGILALQLYNRSKYELDGNAYTFSATIHGGILRIYAAWPEKLPSVMQRESYDLNATRFGMVLVGTWLLNDTLEKCQEALTALRGAITLAEEWRDIFISKANASADADLL